MLNRKFWILPMAAVAMAWTGAGVRAEATQTTQTAPMASASWGDLPDRDAEGVLRLDGEISSMDDQTLVIRAGNLLYELRRDSIIRIEPVQARPGDEVTVEYREAAQQAYPLEEEAPVEGQRPGRLAPESPERLAPPVIDDRAFYFACTIVQ